MESVYLTDKQRQVYIDWLKIFKTNNPEIDLFNDWLKKELFDPEQVLPKKIPYQFNEFIFNYKNLINLSLNDPDPKVQLSALFYLIFYPDKACISIVEKMLFKDKTSEDFRIKVCKFLTEYKSSDVCFPANSKQNNEKDELRNLLHIDLISIDIGSELIPLVDTKQNGELLERINDIRRQIIIDFGLVTPPIRIRDNMNLHKNEYSIKIKNHVVENFKLYPEKMVLMKPESNDNIQGECCTEPVFGLSVKWINKEDKEKAEKSGSNVFDASTILMTHLKEIIKKFGYELLSRQSVEEMINDLKKKSPGICQHSCH